MLGPASPLRWKCSLPSQHFVQAMSPTGRATQQGGWTGLRSTEQFVDEYTQQMDTSEELLILILTTSVRPFDSLCWPHNHQSGQQASTSPPPWNIPANLCTCWVVTIHFSVFSFWFCTSSCRNIFFLNFSKYGLISLFLNKTELRSLSCAVPA